jgi:hypothetical protein
MGRGAGEALDGHLTAPPHRRGNSNRGKKMRAIGREFPSPVVTMTSLILVVLGGCYSWKVEPAPLPELLERPEPPQVIRVDLPGDFQMEIAQPRIEGDSLVGIVPGSDSVRRSVAASQINGIATRHFDGGKTAVAVLVPPLVILSIGSMIALDDFHDSWGD